MNTKITSIKFLSLVLTLFFAVSFGYGQEISSFSSVQNSACGAEIYSDSNISTTGICRSSGIVENAGGTYNSRDWTQNSTLDLDDYLEWTITPNSGYKIDLTTMNIRYDRSPRGPTKVDIQIDLGSGFASIFSDSSVNPNGENVTGIDLSLFTSITSSITFRLYAYDATGTTGTFDIEELQLPSYVGTNKGIVVNGNVSALPPCGTETATWDGTNWNWDGGTLQNTIPTIASTSNVIINGDYDTSVGGFQTSFSACSLVVSNNATLNITDNEFVEVQNNITVDAGSTFLVQPYGSVVQNNDSGDVTNNGTMTVIKKTSFMNNWYEYTYWSSPVKGELINTGLAESQAGRRYVFNAQNYLDATAETGNNNATVAGQDGIDDDGNAWQPVSGTEPMSPGVGYASMNDEIIFGSTFPIGGPKQIDYSFEGPFNNGLITVPIYRNDSELADNNLNFIGNPYPSAIDAQLFLDTNTNIAQDIEGTNYEGDAYMDGAIYLWSQNTEPLPTANGNEDRNFSDSDYAIINGTGETAGGDGVIPNRYIPSGQGFFISMSNTGGTNIGGYIWTGDIIFNNSMRVKGASDNSQFFKNSNTKSNTSTSTINKLWVNLTSDNGVFNQTLIGYTKGATNNYDGAYFDAEKNSSSKAAILYSTIEGSNKVFAIQGKSESSLNEDEIINLGFSTQIDVPTLYTLSIAKLQGDFLSTNTIYVLDNLTNTLHDLSTSDYTFTSDVGEFNNRFQIVFKASSTLSTADVRITLR
ncbi:hypothetical protein [Yeosuana marina]|uniref:hypothetical protein n=1 Tax=Yeosuana marina TaxID=1565536 RepID=UPI0030C88EE2